MAIREYASQRGWKLSGPILPGGTIYSLVLSPNKDQHNPLLAGTPVGVFRSLSRGDNWSWANRGLAGLQISALASSPNGVLFLGTLDGGLARSVDGGYSWTTLPSLQDAGSITAIAVSPDYLSDGTILVGSDAGGVYRSTDSGKTAKSVNFGLGDLSVLCLTCAAGWPKKPVAFAGTMDGLFRSTNGGRAWRPCQGDLEGLPVQAIVTSPRFDRDGIAFAATEEDGIFRTKDGGDSWSLIGDSIADKTVNCLWISPNFGSDRVVLAGTSSSGLFRSADGGETWAQVLDAGNAVLSLAGDEHTIFAGFHNAGAYRSSDGGTTWEPCQEGLFANAFTHLVACSDGTMFATGPDTGIYKSSDGTVWSELTNVPAAGGLAAFVASSDYAKLPLLAFADIEAGVHVSTDGGDSWKQVLTDEVTALCTASDSQGGLILYAGTADGRLLSSRDCGDSWQSQEPFAGQTVLRLEASPSFASDGILVAGTSASGSSAAPVSIWRSRDGGQTWERLIEQEVALHHIGVAIDSSEGRVVAALDRRFLLETGEHEWRRVSAGPGDPPVLTVAIRRQGTSTYYLMGTTLGVYISEDGASWWPMMRGMGYSPILVLAPSVGDERQPVWALGLGGLVWKWDRNPESGSA